MASRISHVEQVIPGKKKHCKKCGQYVKPYVTKCPSCGAPITDEETLDTALLKLRHLFIFHEESGVCLYYHPFTENTIDPQLISGFLSAITSFGGALDSDAEENGKESELKELVYGAYRILLEQSGPCKFAILVQGETSKALTFKIKQFINHFMKTHGEKLKDWKGNVRMFKNTDEMVELIFGVKSLE